MELHVKCPGCSECYHRTTDRYNPDVMTTGDMLEILPKYRDYMWEDFPKDDYVMGDNILCPQCGVPYVNHEGRVTTIEILSDKDEKPSENDEKSLDTDKKLRDNVVMGTEYATVSAPDPDQKEKEERKIEKSETGEFICPQCDLPFLSKKAALKHLKRKHPNII